MSALWRIIGVAYWQFLQWRRQWTWLAQSLVGLFGFSVLLFAWGGVAGLKHAIVASMVAGSWGIGLNIVGQMIGWQKVEKQYEFYVASPLSLTEYYLGVVLGQLPFFIVEVLSPAVIALLLGVKYEALPALTLVVLLALLLGSFSSLTIVLRIKNPMNISAVTNPLYTLTATLPPVFYPMTVLPQPLRPLALIFPTVPLAELARWATGTAETCLQPSTALALTAFWLALSTIALRGVLKWGLEE
ncbi:MAG: ABC transporter permease [Thermofilum sp.]|nr:ABC transporter permease [Thermofilum sp.]